MSRKLGFITVGGHSSDDNEPLSRSAQAIIAAMQESQNHVTRIGEAMVAEQRRVVEEMLSGMKPARVIQPILFDAGQIQRRRMNMPQAAPIGSIFVENTCNANILVFLGEHTTDPTTGQGPPPYMLVAPGKWKRYPVNPYTRVGLVLFVADAVSPGIVRGFLDSDISGAEQGSV